jgi:hypothetical protein
VQEAAADVMPLPLRSLKQAKSKLSHVMGQPKNWRKTAQPYQPVNILRKGEKGLSPESFCVVDFALAAFGSRHAVKPGNLSRRTISSTPILSSPQSAVMLSTMQIVQGNRAKWAL